MSSPVSDHSLLISAVLQTKFGLQAASVHGIGKAQNNFVYQIDLPYPILKPAKSVDTRLKPYISSIPPNTSKFVIRIQKRDVSLENSVRVRNEVAFLALARNATSSFRSSIVPLVFEWEDITSSPGWILEECMSGEVLCRDDIVALDKEKQQFILRQVAQVIKCLQEYRLPDSLTEYGGLTFNGEGKMVSTLMTIPCGGPFHTYAALCRGMCTWQLSASDRSSHIMGWRRNGMRARLDKFFAEGLDQVLTKISEDRPTLIHGDFCLPNLLFDKSSFRLTAVLDFDFSHIGSPISEWLFSFWDLGGILPGSADPIGPIRSWLLNGFPSDDSIAHDENDDGKEESTWMITAAWDKALAEAGVKKPSTIRGAGDTADVWWFSQEICQPYWFIEDLIGKKTPEKLNEMQMTSEQMLDMYLVQWGY
ncbi:hypothetical protein V1524DRAFT_417268 [Lipomyces starkeyi]